MSTCFRNTDGMRYAVFSILVGLNQHCYGNQSRQSGVNLLEGHTPNNWNHLGESVNTVFRMFDARPPTFIEASVWPVCNLNNLHHRRNMHKKNVDFSEHVK